MNVCLLFNVSLQGSEFRDYTVYQGLPRLYLLCPRQVLDWLKKTTHTWFFSADEGQAELAHHPKIRQPNSTETKTNGEFGYLSLSFIITANKL